MIITTTGHGLQVGDVVTMPIRLSRRERFLLWLVRPWRWPVKTYRGKMLVTNVASGTTLDTEWTT